MAIMETRRLLDLTRTLAAPLFAQYRYPWEVLPHLKSFIAELGASLPEDEYTEIEKDVWVHKSATVAKSALIAGPTIIGPGSEIRHCAYIRGSALIGAGCVVGNSTEVKNAVVFDSVQIPHYNYVGDSVLGYKSHMGAGSIASNVRSDKANIVLTDGDARLETGLRKMGAVLGDFVEIGCGSVLCPGAIVGRNTIVYPLTRVRGIIPEDSILKGDGTVVKKR